MTNILSLLLVVFGLFACATTPGSKPQDMTEAGHEAASAEAEQQAAIHTRQFDPNAESARGRCTGAGARRWRHGSSGWGNSGWGNAGWNEFPCWSSTVNPTQVHLDEARMLRKAAADHRAASQALREAEASACATIPPEERDISPFFNREDIERVDLEYATTSADKTLVGATIIFRATPGLTAEWLTRSVECHLARSAAAGHEMPEMAYCPLVPRGVSAAVKSTGTGFAVTITSSDSQSAAEVARRAQALVGTGGAG